MQFNQTNSNLGDVNNVIATNGNATQQVLSIKMADLVNDLERLKAALLAEPEIAQKGEAVAAITKAEEAAKKGDAQGVLSCLKAGGKWALDVATKIGTDLASKAIQAAMTGSSPVG